MNISDKDYREIDIGDFRGIEDARKIRRSVWMKPLASKHTMIVLDEAHAATKDFQTAILKILEEPPAHVIFVLCTTDPLRLLPTIRNRCMRLIVNPLSKKNAKVLFQRAYETLGVDPLPEVFEKEIFTNTLASPRAILNSLERIATYKRRDDLTLLVEQSQKRETQVVEICQKMTKIHTTKRVKTQTWREMMEICRKLEAYGTDPENVRRVIIAFFTKMLRSAQFGKSNAIGYLAIRSFSEPTYDLGWASIYGGLYEFVMGAEE